MKTQNLLKLDFKHEFFRVYNFARYILFSCHKNGHGIHSPFVYKLVTESFNARVSNNEFKPIKEVKRKLRKTTVEVNPNKLGVGSKVNGKTFGVKKILRNVAIPEKYGKYIYNLVKYLKPSIIIELGTSIGISTMYLAQGAPDAKVYSVEGNEGVFNVAKKHLSHYNNVKLVAGDFKDELPLLLKKVSGKLFVFIDGDHQGDRLLYYFNEIAEIANKETVIVIDDIYLNNSLKKAWQEIKQNPKVTVSIDQNRLGTVFFNKELSKQHFIIKY